MYVNDFLYSSYSPPWPNRPHDMKVKDTSESSTATTKKEKKKVGWSSSKWWVDLPMPGNSRYARKTSCTIPTYRNALEDARWSSPGRPTMLWWWNVSLWILRSAWHGAYSTAWANLCMYVFRNLKKIRFRRFMYVCMYVIDSVFFLTNTPWVTPRHVTRSNMYHTNSKVYSVLLYVIVNMYVYILGVLSLTRAGRTASGASLLWFYNCQSQIIRHKLVFESFEIYNYVWLCWLARMP